MRTSAIGRPSRFQVLWGTYDCGKDRPLLCLSPLLFQLAHQAALATTITSVKGRDPREFPGWAFVKKGTASLDADDGFVTLDVFPLLEKARRVEGILPSENADEVVENIRTLLGEDHGGPRQVAPGFLRRLQPPHRRFGPSRNMKEFYRLAVRWGWRPPRQGEVLSAPGWHPRFHDQLLIVVSNTAYNERSRYPAVLVVPALPAAKTELDVAALRAEGRLVLDAAMGLSDDYVCVHERLFTFNFASGWLDQCPRCDESRRQIGSFRVPPGGPFAGRCALCDDVDPSWPRAVTDLAALPAGRPILSELRTRLLRLLGAT